MPDDSVTADPSVPTTDASQSFTEAYRSGNTAAERQQALEDDEDYNTSGGGGGDDDPLQAPRGLQSGRVGGFDGGTYDDTQGGGIADPGTGGGSGAAPETDVSTGGVRVDAGSTAGDGGGAVPSVPDVESDVPAPLADFSATVSEGTEASVDMIRDVQDAGETVVESDAVQGLVDAGEGAVELDAEQTQQGFERSARGITTAARANARNLEEQDLAADAEGTVFEQTAESFEGGAFTFGRSPDRLGTDIAAVGNVPGSAAGALGLGQQADELLQAHPITPGGSTEQLQAEASEDVQQTVDVAQQTAEAAAENPGTAGTRLLLGAGTGVVSGLSAGRGLRAASGARRTSGLDDVEVTDLTNEQTVEFYEGGNADPSNRFPGFDAETAEAEGFESAFRQQADEFTPEPIEQTMSTEGVDTVKGLDVEPDGPGDGFATQPGDFESPGASVGPELSPNFLGLGDDAAGRAPTFGLRPGLPDAGNNPTAAIIRTDIEGRPDITSTEQFNDFLRSREGETTGFIPDPESPDTDVNPGEAEAVIPPDAEFVSAGQDFRTTLAGQTFPVRTFERPDAPLEVDAPAGTDPGTGDLGDAVFGRPGDGGGDGGAPAGRDPAAPADVDVDTDVDTGGAGGTQTFGEIMDEIEAPRQPVDRPAPVPTGGASSPAGGAQGGSPTATPGAETDRPASSRPERGGPGDIFATSPVGGSSPTSDPGESSPPAGGGGSSTPPGGSGGGASSPPGGSSVPPGFSGPFGTSAPPGSSQPPGGSSPPGATSQAPAGTSEPAPSGPPSDPVPFGFGEQAPGRQRRDRDPEDDGGRRREERGNEQQPAASPLFTNPIAGVFSGFDGGPFG